MEPRTPNQPKMHGYDGDGELCVEVCDAAPEEASALLQVERLGYERSDWCVIGRGWCKSGGEDQWYDAAPGEEGALEFWRLRSSEALAAKE